MKFTHYKPGRAIKQFIPYATLLVTDIDPNNC